MRRFFSTARSALRASFVALLVVSLAAPGGAAEAPSAKIAGSVIDASSGLPIANATIVSRGTTVTNVVSDRNGRFTIPSLGAGVYVLTARADGYQSADSDDLALVSDTTAIVTLNLQRVATGNNLRTIGHTSVNAAASLQKASVLYQSINAEQATEQGFYRLGDALRQLPGVVNSGSDTAAPADDINLNIRGIGGLETLTLVDGHPVGYGLSNPYNFDISPAPLFRDVLAVYGSGADQFYPIDAIGGVFDFQTIVPTRALKASFTQQYGTFDTLSSVAAVTGTYGKVGFAFAASGGGLDGPVRHNHGIYSYSASQDPGATDAFAQGAFYNIDTASATHTLLGKIVFPIAKDTTMLASALTESFFDDKTGNGDLDYTPYSVALQNANANLGSKYPIFYNDATAGIIKDPGSDGKGGTATCPSNLVPLFNGAGVPSGTYTQNTIGSAGAASANATQPANKACVTPQQYATLQSGINGAGPAFQTYNLQDYHTRITQRTGIRESYVDGYVDNYTHHYDRDLQLPYVDAPGDNSGSNYEDVVNSGLTVGSTWTTAQNSTGIGIYYNNASYNFIANGRGANNAAAKSDASAFLRESYSFNGTPLTLYGNLWEKSAGETNTNFLDPRAAAVVKLKNDVFRVSAGASTTQPYIAALDQPFSPVALGALNGNVTAGTGGTCSTANSSPISIGSGSNPGLRPERGVDTEASYGHRFFGDSQIQGTFYNTNVYNKIYGFTAPIAVTGTSTIDPAFLNEALQVVRGICGQTFDTTNGLGISTSTNLAHVRAQGLEITGRQRLIRKVALDYDYGATSVVLVDAPDAFLATSGTLVRGSQLPSVPLHQYNAALNYEFMPNANLRFAYHHVSNNNTKNLPAYGYADLDLVAPAGPGRFSIAVTNLFSSQAFDYGLINQGVGLPINAQSGGGTQSTERFGLPYRQIDFTYSLTTK